MFVWGFMNEVEILVCIVEDIVEKSCGEGKIFKENLLVFVIIFLYSFKE